MKFLFAISFLVAALSPLTTNAAFDDDEKGGSVFTMTNAVDGNKVLMYNRDAYFGKLDFVGAYETGKLFFKSLVRTLRHVLMILSPPPGSNLY